MLKEFCLEGVGIRNVAVPTISYIASVIYVPKCILSRRLHCGHRKKQNQPCAGCQIACISLECSTFQRNCEEDCYFFSKLLPVEEDVNVPNIVNDNHFSKSSNDDLQPGFESSSGLTGTTTMDTTEAVISDLQKKKKVAIIMVAKSASRSRKNKVQVPKSRSSSATWTFLEAAIFTWAFHPPWRPTALCMCTLSTECMTAFSIRYCWQWTSFL